MKKQIFILDDEITPTFLHTFLEIKGYDVFHSKGKDCLTDGAGSGVGADGSGAQGDSAAPDDSAVPGDAGTPSCETFCGCIGDDTCHAFKHQGHL